MVDPKEIEQLKSDLELVTQTSKVLATKLEKISLKVMSLMTSLETIESGMGSTPETSTLDPTPTIITPKIETPSQSKPAEKPTSTVSVDGSSSKAGRYLDTFLQQVIQMTKGKEIADGLSNLRDQVMQSAGVGFHPAFHEMGRYSNQLKNKREVTSEEREKLIEKIYDWKERLG